MPLMPPRQALLIAAAAPLLTALALWFYLLVPVASAWADARAQHTLISTAVAQGSSLEPRILELEQQVAALRTELYGQTDGLPPQALQASIMGDLQELSWGHQVQLGGILPREGEQLNIFRSFQFDVDMLADYGQLANWVDHLSQRIGFAVIDRFTLQATEAAEPGQAPELRMRATVNSWRPAPEAP